MMNVKITKTCMVDSWSGLTDLPQVKLKKGDVIEVEGEDDYDDENYSHVGDDGFPNLIIPKENCVVL
jgi:hypothetical protein